MVNIHVGCAGWDYKDWIGPFYPKNLEKSLHLEYYAKYFNLVEVNSTFYNLPAEETIINWNKRVPLSFRFIIKAWKNITHDPFSPNISSYISQFFYSIESLNDKISGILLQFPPWFKYSTKHLKRLNYLVNQFPPSYRYFIELREDSWFEPDIIKNFITSQNIILGTVYLDDLREYYYPNQKIYYIRLIGDRKLQYFNIVQRQQENKIKRLLDFLNKIIASVNIKEMFIIVNNHFTGFSPETANLIKKKLNLRFESFSNQKKLIDFL